MKSKNPVKKSGVLKKPRLVSGITELWLPTTWNKTINGTGPTGLYLHYNSIYSIKDARKIAHSILEHVAYLEGLKK